VNKKEANTIIVMVVMAFVGGCIVFMAGKPLELSLLHMLGIIAYAITKVKVTNHE
jgi:hypothetical protein